MTETGGIMFFRFFFPSYIILHVDLTSLYLSQSKVGCFEGQKIFTKHFPVDRV